MTLHGQRRNIENSFWVEDAIKSLNITKTGYTRKLIKKYIGIEKLDAAILNDLIEKITVGEKYMQDGKKTQDIDIYYKFAGRVAV